MTTPTGTPAGWYPDPERPGAQRYWDGAAWTEHLAAGEAAAAEPAAAVPEQPVAAPAAAAPVAAPAAAAAGVGYAAAAVTPAQPGRSRRAAPATPKAGSDGDGEESFFGRPAVIVGAAIALVVVLLGAYFLTQSSDDVTSVGEPSGPVATGSNAEPGKNTVVVVPPGRSVGDTAKAIKCEDEEQPPVIPEGATAATVCQIDGSGVTIVAFATPEALQEWATTVAGTPIAAGTSTVGVAAPEGETAEDVKKSLAN